MKKLITIMLKIGAIGFGGGTALIPVIEDEVVNNSLADEDEFNKDVIVANITPGALPVEIASGTYTRCPWNDSGSLYDGFTRLIFHYTAFVPHQPLQRRCIKADNVCICRRDCIYYFYAS